jgi:hypothetical protein
MALSATSPSIVDRMMRAAKLEVPLYEEVEADTTATNQALMVVVLVAIASGIGAAIAAGIAGSSAGILVARLVSAGPSGRTWCISSARAFSVAPPRTASC